MDKHKNNKPLAQSEPSCANGTDTIFIKERDLLTGTYNRQGFISQVETLLKQRNNENYAILFYNIKGFKAVNEIFGIECGDDVLNQSIELLKNSKLNPIYIARFEADHFVCIINQTNLNYEEIGNLCKRSFVYNDKKFNFYARIGIYLVNDRTKNVSAMCDRAKLAKDYIQDDFAKPYSTYNIEMRDNFVAEKELTSELVRAIGNQEFVVYYQPVFDLKTEKIASAEALVRWNHPQKGLLMPGRFIPIFEKNGYISELDSFIAQQSINFIKNRISQNKFSVPIAVNLSRMDFYDENLLENIVTNIKDAGMSSGYHRIEITESAYSALVENDNKVLQKIKNAGIKILLDDFGSGYSSFSTLREFDFDIIKLDMGFIRQIGTGKKSMQIISSIIQLVHNIGAKVIAEGVETEQQANFLKKENCDYVQGYLYSKPLTQNDFEKLLDNSN